MRSRHLARQIGGMSIALLLAVGCSATEESSDSSVAGTTATTTAIASPPSTTPATPPAATDPAPTVPASTATTVAIAAPPAAAPDAAALLAGALSSLGSEYRFSGTITLDGATAATAEGDRVGPGTRFDVTSNEATVSYVVLPEATWVRQGEGGWEVLQDPPAAVDPIDALVTPLGVSLIAGDAQAGQIDVTVDSTTLGIAGDSPVVVHASVAGGALTSVAYETVQNGVTAQITTSFGPVTDATPVVAPA